MRVTTNRVLSGFGVVALSLGLAVVGTPVASAVPSNAVDFACFNGVQPDTGVNTTCPAATFSGYANGTEAHLSALQEPAPIGTTLANLDQGFSGASTASAGLTKVINSETTSVVQPAQAPSVKAYGTGAGLELGLGVSNLPTTDQNQIKLAGRAEQIAPPNGPAKTSEIAIPASPLLNADVLKGEGAAVYDPQVCPLGQPISYGYGNAAGVQALIPPGMPPLVSLAGSGTSVAQSTSQTLLTENPGATGNGDGTYGVETVASDIIAPVSVNIPGGLSVRVAVQSAGGVNDPVTLTAKSTGESTGASIKFSSDDILKVDLVAPTGTTNIITIPLTAVGQGGLHIPLSTDNSQLITQLTGAVAGVAGTLPAVGPQLQSILSNPQLQGVLSQINTQVSQVSQKTVVISLGYLDVDTYPHVIGHPATDPAVPVGGTSASGALDLLHLNLTLSGSAGGTPLPISIPLANLFAGHLEAAANQTAPIACHIPIVKTSNPESVTAGQDFTYNISVPDPAKLNLIDCNLDNITVTDTISDDPKDTRGNPTFEIVDATDTATGAKGTIDKTTNTVTWTGLSYKVAGTGQPPNPPIPLAIKVHVPSTSPAGTIMDVVQATGTTSGCQGGVAGPTSVGATSANGNVLTGSFTLEKPSVNAVAVQPASSAPAKKLPFTGAMGGLWQPLGGLGALALGGGALALVRRARRISS